ncbi:MAG: GAF domain-containing protein [Xylophilus ampelinus]
MTADAALAVLPVTLDNCDQEPIHIPGSIQRHGVLLAFDGARRLCHASDNAAAILDRAPALGEPLAPEHFGAHPEIHAALEDAFATGAADVLPLAVEITLDGARFDLLAHRSNGLLIVEFERRMLPDDALAAFALKAHRSMAVLKRQRSLDALLDSAVTEVRALTGFDRVMAYRFRHDDSGDVVAESRSDALEPFVGRRYPASDIPAQARRLYAVNTLRTIVDIGSAPVPVVAAPEQTSPLDMSHAVLRSVSPIHIEYLTNMGVRSSMSISIVVQGRLWGMLACHHMAPHQVPYSLRMACDVIAQILAASVQTLLTRAHADRLESAALLRAQFVERTTHSDDLVATISELLPPLVGAFDAQAAIVAEGSKLWTHGDLPQDGARALVQWLETQGDARGDGQIVDIQRREDLPPALAEALGTWCGLLALPFDRQSGGWLVFLRKEQIETIQWGGRPEKEYKPGPLGMRLTPRGSFDVWRQTVRGVAVAWDETEREMGRQLLDELMRVTAHRVTELSRARNQLLAVLGHDLRDPLHSISMAARVLEQSQNSSGGRLGQRIQSSSSRMQRLVSQVLDMSRLQGGLGLGLQFAEVDLAPLIHDLLDESAMAHPGTRFEKRIESPLMATVDVDRMAQVVTNLVSNARHHGGVGQAIQLDARREGCSVVLEVRNVGNEIPPELAGLLFNPFKRQSLGNQRNKTGLGLGLYIAHEIVQSHRGTIAYRFDAPHVVFTVRFPAHP